MKNNALNVKIVVIISPLKKWEKVSQLTMLLRPYSCIRVVEPVILKKRLAREKLKEVVANLII